MIIAPIAAFCSYVSYLIKATSARCEHFLQQRKLEKLVADPTLRDNNGATALHWACKHGRYNRVMDLLKDPRVRASAQLNAQDKNGNTPLILALENRNESIAQALLNAGADPSVKNNHDEMALGWALYLDSPQLAEAILKKLNLNPECVEDYINLYIALKAQDKAALREAWAVCGPDILETAPWYFATKIDLLLEAGVSREDLKAFYFENPDWKIGLNPEIGRRLHLLKF